MKNHHLKSGSRAPDPREAAHLSDFGDALVSGTPREPRTDVEATMARVQRALGADLRAGEAMPASLKRAVWEDEMRSTSVLETTRLPMRGQPTGTQGRRRSTTLPSLARVTHGWQAAISLALVLIVLGGLVGVVTQHGD